MQNELDRVAVLGEIREMASTIASLRLESDRKGREIERLREALEFYANPLTYFAIGFICDSDPGEFINDFDNPDPRLGEKPGKLARAALELPTENLNPFIIADAQSGANLFSKIDLRDSPTEPQAEPASELTCETCLFLHAKVNPCLPCGNETAYSHWQPRQSASEGESEELRPSDPLEGMEAGPSDMEDQ